VLTKIISRKALERAEEWKKALKTLVGSKRSMTFVLGDEPEDLIEDMSVEIALAIELEEAEKGVEDLIEDMSGGIAPAINLEEEEEEGHG
jgi:hypothetical protein